MTAGDFDVKLLRHATLQIQLGDKNLLVDPMLSEPGAIPPIPNRRIRPSQFFDLDLKEFDGVLVTHTHRDHLDLDDAAKATLPTDLPLFCQPEDEDELAEEGFEDIRPVDETENWETVELVQTDGRHGTGEIGVQMGPVSGFMIRVNGGPLLYLAGNTIWCPEVEDALSTHTPDMVIVNTTGETQFVESDPITMTKEGVAEVCRAVPEATIITVRMDAINHCHLSQDALWSYLRTEGLGNRVRIRPRLITM